jgi:hypothetical protein
VDSGLEDADAVAIGQRGHERCVTYFAVKKSVAVNGA